MSRFDESFISYVLAPFPLVDFPESCWKHSMTQGNILLMSEQLAESLDIFCKNTQLTLDTYPIKYEKVSAKKVF